MVMPGAAVQRRRRRTATVAAGSRSRCRRRRRSGTRMTFIVTGLLEVRSSRPRAGQAELGERLREGASGLDDDHAGEVGDIDTRVTRGDGDRRRLGAGVEDGQIVPDAAAGGDAGGHALDGAAVGIAEGAVAAAVEQVVA